MANIKELLGQAFDSAAVEPQTAFEPLPAGMYTLEVAEADVADTKKGDGKLLKLKQTVIDPVEYANRVVFSNITLRNPNAQAEEIGARQLSGLCRAAGIGTLQDSDELVGKIVRAKLKVQPAKDGYEASNVVAAYESANATAPKPATKPAPAKTAAPWAKKAA
jgi:hypothetical protein